MDISFANKRILVTGSASGIGRGIALRLAKHGGTVIALDRSREQLEKLAKENASVIPIYADLCNWADSQEAIRKVFPIDMLVNCAGIAEIFPFTENSEEAYKRTMDINVKGLISTTQVVVQNLLQTKSPGSIVNISSQASQAGLLHHTNYSASKAAVDGFTRSLALELGPKGIRVNCVNPTVVLTPLGIKAWEAEGAKEELLKKIPLRRFAEIDDVVDAVVFLLSDKSNMITGHCLAVDGGYLAC